MNSSSEKENILLGTIVKQNSLLKSDKACRLSTFASHSSMTNENKFLVP